MSEKKFPDIRVGYQTISVHVLSDDQDGRLEDVEGLYHSCQAKIHINSKQCHSEQVASLFHEVLHACFFTYGMKQIIDDKDKEEYIVSTLGGAIMQVLIDNPQLVREITKCKK